MTSLDEDDGSVEEKLFLKVLIVLVVLCSFFGNSVLIHLIRTENLLKTTTNHLVLCQAVADILITVIRLLHLALRKEFVLGYYWFGGILGLITCKSYFLLQFATPVFSIWLLTLIAVERLFAVTRPLQCSPLSQHLKKTISVIGIWSLASFTDIIVHGKVTNDEERYYCGVTFSGTTLVFCATNIFFSLIIISAFYAIVCYKLCSRKVPGEGNSQNQRQAEAIKTARKVTLMMIVIIVLFMISWGPSEIVLVLQILKITPISTISVDISNLTLLFSSLNPYIYFTFNQSFRKAFRALFVRCSRKIEIHRVIPFRSRSTELQQI